MREPGGLLPSNVKRRPETCGNRPVMAGHLLTPFSRPCNKMRPGTRSFTTTSGKGSSATSSRSVMSPGFTMHFPRMVPAVMKPISASTLRRAISAMKLPALVSRLLAALSLISISVAVAPTMESIFASSSPKNLATIAAITGSTVSAVLRRWRHTAMAKGELPVAAASVAGSAARCSTRRTAATDSPAAAAAALADVAGSVISGGATRISLAALKSYPDLMRGGYRRSPASCASMWSCPPSTKSMRASAG